LKPDAPLLIKGVLDVEDSGIRKIRVSEIQSIEGLRERMAKSVIVHVNLERVTQETPERLQRVLDGHPGEASVIFELEHPKAYLVTLRPNQFVRVKPCAQLVQEVESLCGPGAVKF
jgi:DNA polymerase III alpha subunit